MMFHYQQTPKDNDKSKQPRFLTWRSKKGKSLERLLALSPRFWSKKAILWLLFVLFGLICSCQKNHRGMSFGTSFFFGRVCPFNPFFFLFPGRVSLSLQSLFFPFSQQSFFNSNSQPRCLKPISTTKNQQNKQCYTKNHDDPNVNPASSLSISPRRLKPRYLPTEPPDPQPRSFEPLKPQTSRPPRLRAHGIDPKPQASDLPCLKPNIREK